ncbi:hypothetical protein ABZS66_49490 [Dactylosporangium sp. NPDC005572]|uniref:hypothetical protein n=1 Tax=Dactylosporangium sp. NPDC005572 TaxID=3156889 RepID=UPI0033A8044C
MTQARCHQPAKDLITRRNAGGDGGLDALRVLKRRLSDVVYQALRTDFALTFGQPELERWQGDPAGGYRYEAATFIRWAHANKLTTAYPQTGRWRGPVNTLNDVQRWAIARQLLHDTTIATEDRLAGLLLLLYAQRPFAIGPLTTDQITISDDAVSISLGRTPIRLPHPVDELPRSVIATRKSHATIGAAPRRSGCSPEDSPAARSASNDSSCD